MVRSRKAIHGQAKPGLMGAVAGENAVHSEWLELLSIRTRYTKQILYQRLTPAEREAFQERAAMVEHASGMTRDDAEWEALTQLIHTRLFRVGSD